MCDHIANRSSMKESERWMLTSVHLDISNGINFIISIDYVLLFCVNKCIPMKELMKH